MKGKLLALTALLLLGIILVSFDQKSFRRNDSTTQMLAALDSFKTALNDRWSYRYANNADYNEQIEQLQKKIVKGITMDEFGVEIEKILALGIDGHSRVRGYEWPEGGCLPFLIEAENSRFIAINPQRTGFLIDEFPYLTKIDGKPIEQWCAKAAARVPKGSPQWVRHRSIVRFLSRLDYWRGQFDLPKKQVVSVELTDLSGKKKQQLELKVVNQPLPYGVWPARTSQLLPDNIGYLRLATMQKKTSISEIETWMPKFREADGLVIDVRDNDGGDRDALYLLYSFLAQPGSEAKVFNAAAYRLHPLHDESILSGHFMFTEDSKNWNKKAKEAIKRFRRSFVPEWQLPKGQFTQWYYSVLQHQQTPSTFYFKKPVVILMNAKCFSATDIFLAGLKGVKNVTLIGTPSGGGSGNKETVRLGITPITIEISRMASFQSNGKLFDGNGVQPDLLVSPNPEYYIGGADNVLNEALTTIKNKKIR